MPPLAPSVGALGSGGQPRRFMMGAIAVPPGTFTRDGARLLSDVLRLGEGASARAGVAGAGAGAGAGAQSVAGGGRRAGTPGTAAAIEDPRSLEPIRQGLLTMHTLLSGMEEPLGMGGRVARRRTGEAPGPGPGARGGSGGEEEVKMGGGGGGGGGRDLDVAPMVVDEPPLPGPLGEGAGPSSSASSSSSASGFVGLSGDRPSGERPPNRCNRSRSFFVGQWLDVKDTVNQWLEATVMDINPQEGSLKVHYNGWPTRWDEWVPFTSQRIAPFRTRTVHSAYSPYISPSPVSAVRNAPSTGQDDVRVVIPEVLGMVRRVERYLSCLSEVCESQLAEQEGDTEEVERPWLDRMPWEAERVREEGKRRRRRRAEEKRAGEAAEGGSSGAGPEGDRKMPAVPEGEQ
jgi:hypothetical protein